MKKFIVSTYQRLYYETEITARSIEGAWAIAHTRLAEGTLDAEFVHEGDTEIQHIIPAKKDTS